MIRFGREEDRRWEREHGLRWVLISGLGIWLLLSLGSRELLKVSMPRSDKAIVIATTDIYKHCFLCQSLPWVNLLFDITAALC